jgi:hypothetical protein
MAIIDFDFHQQFDTRDKLPDHRSDGEILNSPLSSFNHDSSDISYAERLAEEIVNVSGAWITVFKRNRNVGGGDKVWDEDSSPSYDKGRKLKGYFEPSPAEILLSKWGVDVENKFQIHFSRSSVLQTFGINMISEGDVLIVPHNTLTVAQNVDLREGIGNRLDTFRVIKSSDTGNFKYRWLYWSVLCENVTGDESIQVEFRNERS